MGVFHREAAQSQDSVDPITELLSQLSGGWIESVPILYACTCIYIYMYYVNYTNIHVHLQVYMYMYVNWYGCAVFVHIHIFVACVCALFLVIGCAYYIISHVYMYNNTII